MSTAMHRTQITGKKRDRASSEESSDDELVAPELLDPLAGVQQRKKARLGFRGCQWIAVFGERNPMKQRCAPGHSFRLLLLALLALSPLSCCRQSTAFPCIHLWEDKQTWSSSPLLQECAWQCS